MAADLEEQKKAILPFMQRAQEIQQADPKVAYYCRMYGVEQALKFPQRAKEVNALLGSALSQLEKDKAKLDLDPVGDRIHCLGFALRIFDNADRVDRAGKATERTSKAFYAASVFIEILNHFGAGVDAELLEKQRYCAWRAAEIRKALREGRQPLPPPAAEPPPPPEAAAAAGGPGALDDLPPASGSSDWAYGGSGQVPPRPPPGSVGDGFGAGGMPGAGSYAAPPPPPQQPSPSGYHVPPPAPPPSAASSFSATTMTGGAPDGSAQAAGGGARYWPGAKMLVRVEEGLDDGYGGGGEGQTHAGTVGQVIRRPDGGFSYKVALSDRLVDVPDEAAVPAVVEGGYASMLPQRPMGPGPAPPQAQAPVTVRVVMINDASWPPQYLVQGHDGKEISVSAHQLAPPPHEAATSAARPSAPPPPAPAPEFTYAFADPSAPAATQPPAYPQRQRSLPPSPPRVPTAPPPPPAAPVAGATSSPYPTASGGAYAAPTAPPPPRPPPSYAHSYSGPAPSQGWGKAEPAPAPMPAPATAPTLPPGFKPSLQAITDAQKQAKYAISALSFEDVPTAVKNLTEALRLLTSPGAAPSHRR